MHHFAKTALFALAAALFSCNKKPARFEHLPASLTKISFANNLDTTKNHRALYHFYHFNGGGVATGDLNNDGLDDLYFTANSRGANKLYINRGNFQFEDITKKAGVTGTADWCSGATMADVNGDGWLDIYVSSVNGLLGMTGHNALFINNKDCTFTESAEKHGLAFATFGTQSAFFDFDNDDDLDCYLLNQSQKPSENLRDTSFRREFSELAGDRLLRNDLKTTGRFTDVSRAAGIFQSSLGYGLGLAIADLDLDGDGDIFVGNDFHENDYCYFNNGDGTFSERGGAVFNHFSRFSMGCDVGDLDNDGQPDIFTADMLPPDERHLKTYSGGENLDIYNLIITKNGYQPQFSRNALHRNNGGARSFSDIALLHNMAATDWSWSPLMADFDNDGLKDLFISAGIVKRTVDLDFTMYLNNIKIAPGQDPKTAYNKALALLPDGASHNFFFKNGGENGFSDASLDWGLTEMGYHTGAAHADLDNDGDLDLVVNPVNATAFVLKNNAPPRSFLKIKPIGNAPNCFGMGAKFWLFSKKGIQFQEMTAVKGFQSSSVHGPIFGLDSLKMVDSLLVVWPGGKFQVLKNLPPGAVSVDQKDAAGHFIHEKQFPKTVAPGENFTQTVPKLGWKHTEDAFNDFTEQYLLPHQWSARGPKIAVADVDADGLDDFFVCGAAGQPGAVFLQKKDGRFEQSGQPALLADKDSEDVDAVFLDANGDKKPDLLVVSGGNRAKPGDPNLLDRLYLNDGKGHFSKSEDALPKLAFNKTCAAAGDVDGDGDADIFIGVASQPGSFGRPTKSFLLINDGRGNFSAAPEKVFDGKNIGFPTAAKIVDLNGDGRAEIIVANEWAAIEIIENRGGIFEKRQLDGSGLWQGIFVFDANSDGKLDILAGNWGKNSKLKAEPGQPLKMYVNDFDKNGQLDPIVACTKNRQEFPFLGKDELERVLPFLKKKFPRYALFAGKTIGEVFDLKLAGTQIFTVETTASSVFLNDGNGHFSRTELPSNCQLSPIFSFEKNAVAGQFLAAGNFFGVRPFEGQYDAAALQSFGLGPAKNGQVISIKGEIRDIAWLKTGRGRVLVAAKNDGKIEFFEPK